MFSFPDSVTDIFYMEWVKQRTYGVLNLKIKENG